MRVKYIINNYQLGAKMKSTPIDKIVSQTRVDSRHTEVTYLLGSDREKQFCDRVYAKCGKVEGD